VANTHSREPQEFVLFGNWRSSATIITKKGSAAGFGGNSLNSVNSIAARVRREKCGKDTPWQTDVKRAVQLVNFNAYST
jgi:hypothetical protein